jgi:hypothetical protein
MRKSPVKSKVKDAGAASRAPATSRSLSGVAPRVDVAKVCGNRAGRERVYGILRQVHQWGVLREIGGYIRVEKGAARRGPIAWDGIADKCSAAIQCGFNLFDELAVLVMQVVQGAGEFVGVAEKPTGYEETVLAGLQRWLDAVTASPELLNGFMCEIIAGFGGCDVEGLRRFNSASGVEAAFQLSWSVRNAIAKQSEHPFLWMGLVEGQSRRATPARGRSRPPSPVETDADDWSILSAVAKGESSGKGIASKSASFGRAVKYDYVRKRKRDLVLWGLVDKCRPWKLTSQGIAWVRAMHGSSGAASPST